MGKDPLGKQKRLSAGKADLSLLVPRARLELAHLSAADFESELQPFGTKLKNKKSIIFK
jgi:hypothetical protein